MVADAIDVEYTPFDDDGEPVRISPRTGKPMRHRRSKEELAAARGDVEPESVNPKPSRMKGEIQALIETGNELLKNFPVTKEDALTDKEATDLIAALDRAQQSSARLRKLLKRTTTGSGVLGLVIVGILIALPRLQRHGLIPGTKKEPTAAEQLAAEWYAQRGTRPQTAEEWAQSVAQAEAQLAS